MCSKLSLQPHLHVLFMCCAVVVLTHTALLPCLPQVSCSIRSCRPHIPSPAHGARATAAQRKTSPNRSTWCRHSVGLHTNLSYGVLVKVQLACVDCHFMSYVCCTLCAPGFNGFCSHLTQPSALEVHSAAASPGSQASEGGSPPPEGCTRGVPGQVCGGDGQPTVAIVHQFCSNSCTDGAGSSLAPYQLCYLAHASTRRPWAADRYAGR